MDTAAMMSQVQSVAPSPYQEEAGAESWTVRNTEADTAQHVTTLNMTLHTTHNKQYTLHNMTQHVTLVTVVTVPTSSPAVAATVSCAALAPGLGGVEAAEADQPQPQRGLGSRHGEVRCPAGDHCSLSQPRHRTRSGQRRIRLCSAASPRWRSPEAAAATQTGRGEAGRLGPCLH